MIRYEIRINKFAQKDIIDATDYYNDKKAGLGYNFWQEVKYKLTQIENKPLQFQIIKDKTRRANINRFPFGILYIVNNSFIDIFAIIHFSRSPEIWQKRIDIEK